MRDDWLVLSREVCINSCPSLSQYNSIKEIIVKKSLNSDKQLFICRISGALAAKDLEITRVSFC